MATTKTTNDNQQEPPGNRTDTPPVVPDLRVIEIGKIQVREGFNPRNRRGPDGFDRTVSSVAQDGVLAPVLVTPTGPDADTFWLVAGEGRYRAAKRAGQTSIPVLVRKVDARTEGLELALAENLAREDLDPVAVAHGFDRLKRAGWGKRQIAEQFSITQKLVTDRLQILRIPDELHPQIATGEIPLSAIKPLARMAQAHPDLPGVLVHRVLQGEPAQAWVDPLDWPTVVDDPVGALTVPYEGPGTTLPNGVYDAATAFALDDLPLSEGARKDLRELTELRRVDPVRVTVRVAREGVEQARALGALVSSDNGIANLIVGRDVLVQVIADQTRAALKQARRLAKPQSAATATGEAAPGASNAPTTDADGTPTSGPSEEEVTERRRRERAAMLEARRVAREHNAGLGAAVVRSLVRLKLDERTLKVLLAGLPLLDLSGLAMRGARYCLPGWPVEETTSTGKTKTTYPDADQTRRKTREFLDGASTVGEITGRVFSLIALARYADEQAVAQSNRSTYRFPQTKELPWDEELFDLIDEICAERLPERLTAPARQRRREFLAEQERLDRERREAEQRVRRALRRVSDLSAEERTTVVEDAKRAWGPWSPKVRDVRNKTAETTSATAEAPGPAAGDPTEYADTADDPGDAEATDTPMSRNDDSASEGVPAVQEHEADAADRQAA
ncbi:MAG: ParB/RepB/Spo0J family partition protein [Solirubrobacteraceae bacterium]